MFNVPFFLLEKVFLGSSGQPVSLYRSGSGWEWRVPFYSLGWLALCVGESTTWISQHLYIFLLVWHCQQYRVGRVLGYKECWFICLGVFNDWLPDRFQPTPLPEHMHQNVLFATVPGPPERGIFSVEGDAYSEEDLVSKLTPFYMDEVEHSVAACRILEANCPHVFWQCDFKYIQFKKRTGRLVIT